MSDEPILRITNQGPAVTTAIRLGALELTNVFTLDFTPGPAGPFVSALVRMAAQADLYATYDGAEALGEWAILARLFPQIGPPPRPEVHPAYVHLVTHGGGGTDIHPTVLTEIRRPDGQAFRWVGVETCHAEKRLVHAKLHYPFAEANWPLDWVGQYADDLRALIQGMTYREIAA